MSDIPGEGLKAAESGPPTQEQLADFAELVIGLIVRARSKTTQIHEMGISNSAYYRLGPDTVVSVGFNNRLTGSQDELDVMVSTGYPRAGFPGIQIGRNFTAVYSMSEGSYQYQEAIDAYKNGRTMRTKEDWRILRSIMPGDIGEPISTSLVSALEVSGDYPAIAEAVPSGTASLEWLDKNDIRLTRGRIDRFNAIMGYLMDHPEAEETNSA